MIVYNSPTSLTWVKSPDYEWFSQEKMIQLSAKTALKRRKLSAPMRTLVDHKMIRGRALDYGCGHGFDADSLGISKWDPNHSPIMPEGLFDTITMIYVTNTLGPEGRYSAITRAAKRLRSHGRLFVAHRDDIKVTRQTKIGTFQFADKQLHYPTEIQDHLSRRGSWITHMIVGE